jgi:hypothetical protein
MGNLSDIVWLVVVFVAAVAMVFVVRARRRQHGESLHELATENVCPHLRPALEELTRRGHRVVRVGQKLPEMPLEIHVAPGFDPKSVAEQLGLTDPVFVSAERNVLFCKEDWCELHPTSG